MWLPGPSFFQHGTRNPPSGVSKGERHHDDIVEGADHRQKFRYEINWRQHPQSSEHHGQLRSAGNTRILSESPNRGRAGRQEADHVLHQPRRQASSHQAEY
jgi:hypothetical protein